MTIVVGLLAWVVATVVVQSLCWRTPASVGLPVAFLASIGVIHLPGALVHALPWYVRPSHDLVEEGFALSTLGAVALALGHLWHHRRRRREPAPRPPVRRGQAWSRRDGLRYLVAGLTIHLIVLPLLHGVPTLTAVLSAGLTLAVCGLQMLIYAAWVRGDRPALVRWLLVTLLFPVMTVVSGGYLGFGVAVVLGTFCFVTGFVRPRWRPYGLVLLLLYPALCVYVTYMRDRTDIRAVVWGGGALHERAGAVADTFLSPELFDPFDTTHLRRFDDRLNQNILVGQAARNMERSRIEFARGGTIVDAFLALVPRALWPDKPLKAGGAEVVSRYTGQTFGGNTSVGVGTVLELYINFGAPGILLGFAALGVLLSKLDLHCGAMLAAGRQGDFLVAYLPAMSLLGSAANSFLEVSASVAGALLLALAMRRWLSRRALRPAATAPRR